MRRAAIIRFPWEDAESVWDAVTDYQREHWNCHVMPAGSYLTALLEANGVSQVACKYAWIAWRDYLALSVVVMFVDTEGESPLPQCRPGQYPLNFTVEGLNARFASMEPIVAGEKQTPIVIRRLW